MEHTRISHYQVGRRLGRGGMGEVYEALDLDLDRRVALKFVAPELAADANALKRLEHEARAAAALQHPHIATLYAFEREGERRFIAMELVGGGSLRDRIRDGPLPVAEALAIARAAAEALALAHRRGVVHRDVKPENLMFDEDGVVKLMDFGLARATQASRMTMTGSALGTAAYMPPESMRGGAGAPGDVFALGVTLHEMLAGELPFHGDSPLALLYTSANEEPRPLRAARPDAPEAVADLVMRMLAKDPERRPDVGAVARELGAIAGAPVPVGAEDTVEVDVTRIPGGAAAQEDALLVPAPVTPVEPRRGGARRRVVVGAGVVLFVGMLVLGALLERRGSRRQAAVALNNRGYELLSHDSLAEARSTLEAALAADRRNAQAMLNLAVVHHKTGDGTRAAALLGRVIKDHPGNRALVSGAHFWLAEIDMASGALASAIDHYRSALALDSTNVLYPNNLAYALIRAGRPNEAAPTLVQALSRFPGEALLHKNLGLALLRAGTPDGALPALDAALERDPGLASAWGLRAEAKARLRDLAGARADWDMYLGMAHDETERPGIEARLRALGAITR